MKNAVAPFVASSKFTTMFEGRFARSGTRNYPELAYSVPEICEFTVTVQA